MDSKENSRFLSKLKYDFPYICIFSVAFSHIGWLIENLARALLIGTIDNRFHLLPFIPVYGLVPFAVYICGDPDHFAIFGHKLFKKETKKSIILSNLIFLFSLFFWVFFGELIVGNLWEILFGVQLWNYLNQPFHVTRYAGLLSTLAFGIAMFILVKYVFNPLLKKAKESIERKSALKYILFYGILLVDMIIMMVTSAVLGHGPIYWSFNVKENPNTFWYVVAYLAALATVITVISLTFKKRKKKKATLENTESEENDSLEQTEEEEEEITETSQN